LYPAKSLSLGEGFRERSYLKCDIIFVLLTQTSDYKPLY